MENIQIKIRVFVVLRRELSKLFGVAVFCLAPVIGVYSQSSPVTWTLNTVSAKTVKAGGKFDARLSANISGGWYLYSPTQPPGGPNATRITVASEPTFKLAGTIKAPPPKVKFDENFGMIN